MTLLAFLRHLAFALSLSALSAAIVRVMLRVRIMDTPDDRKAHNHPTPKGGGLGIVVAFLVGIYVLYSYASFSRIADPYFRGVILASAAIALVAFLDDLRDWPFTIKLAAQILAASAAVGSGLYVHAYSVPYLGPRGLADFDLVLSYTGGGALDALRDRLGAPRVLPLYGHVDPDAHRPTQAQPHYASDLSYLGTYAADRQAALEELFIEPARRRSEWTSRGRPTTRSRGSCWPCS